MKFVFHYGALDSLNSDLLALGVFEEQLATTTAFTALDRALAGRLAALVAEEGFQGKTDQQLLLHTLGCLPLSRLLLVGLGPRGAFDVADTRRYAALVANAAQAHRCASMGLVLPPLDGTALPLTVQFATEGVLLGSYRFQRYRSKESRTKQSLRGVTLCLEGQEAPDLPLAVQRAEVISQAVCLARDLVNEPSSVITPTALADLAARRAEELGLDCKVLGPRECEKQRMGLFLAVARGSVEEPRFIHLTYKPRGRTRSRKRIVLVGKGITFDAGGLNLKAAASMLDMKTDMAGAAALIALMGALPALGVSAEVHGLVAACENMPSGSAYRLGDIVTGLGGKSVEIANTDAEGRLVMADALAYGVKLSPDEIIDIATLTAACAVALGPHLGGVMGNDRALIERFLAAAQRSGEAFWPLPLPTRLKEQLKSPLADLKNVGDRWGGALVAGLFLQEFVGGVPWLHLDIAGPATADKEWGHLPKGGTGFGVVALLEHLQGLGS